MPENDPGAVKKPRTLFPLPDPITEPERRREPEAAVSAMKKRLNVVPGQMALDLDLSVDNSRTSCC